MIAAATNSVAECLRAAQLQLHKSDSARLDAEVLLSYVLNKSRTWLYTWPEKPLSADQYQLFLQLISRRESGEPIAYITGEREFWSLSFLVSAATLIPRPDTELLVEAVLGLGLGCAESTTSVSARKRVLDLGTGTGAIAIALATELPQAEIVAVDCSAEAVALAEKNRQRHACKNLRCIQSDWYSVLRSPAGMNIKFDVIVSNPPYIAASDEHLECGDVRFEPRSALVAEHDGLADIETIIDQARSFLVPGGWLLLEHGWRQAAAVTAIFNRCGYGAITTRQDLVGNDRVTLAQYKS